MELGANEYTIKTLKEYLNTKYKNKLSGKGFNNSDIAQYCMRGYLPHRYGGNVLDISVVAGVKIITLK